MNTPTAAHTYPETETHHALVPQRFCGPPRSGNGGYTAALLGKQLGPQAEVTLKKPIPLDSTMESVVEGSRAWLFHNGEEIATAEVAELELEIPASVGLEQAAAAEAGFLGLDRHPFPTCFVCGTERMHDGLCLFTGQVRDGVAACTWVPGADLGNANGEAPPEIVGAALDCPGAWAMIEQYSLDGPLVLGRFRYRIHRSVLIDQAHVVMGWSLGRERRKHYCGTALFDADGNLCAAASAIWIKL